MATLIRNDPQERGANVTRAHDALPHAVILVRNADVAAIFAELLMELGWTSVIASNAEAGLALAVASTPALFLCDLRLAGYTNGLDVAACLRTEESLDDTRLVALLDADWPEAQLAARAAGFDHALVKPVRFAQLEQVLQSCANRMRHAVPCTHDDDCLAGETL